MEVYLFWSPYVIPLINMFSLVSFAEEKDDDGSVPCEIVPNGWFSVDLKSCWWPPGLNGYSSAFPNAQPTKKWKLCKNIEIKFTSDDLKEVQRRRERYITNLDTSNVESNAEDDQHQIKGTRPNRTKFKVNTRHELLADGSSESDEDLNLPIPPAVPPFAQAASFKQLNIPVAPEASTSTVRQLEIQAEGNQQIQFVTTADGNLIELIDPGVLNTIHPQAATLDVQQLILKKIEGLSRKIDDLATELRDLRPVHQARPEVLGEIPKHPASTVEELEDLNAFCLLSSSNSEKLALTLSQMGGKTLKGATENVLAELMGDSLAMELNWAGTKRGDTQKLAFKQYKLTSGIFDAVWRMKYHSNAQNTEMISCIQVWLKNAKGRSTGWKKVPDPEELDETDSEA